MFGFLPHNLFTNHIGQNTSGLSPRLWSKISGTIMAGDGQKRLVLAGDDFILMQGIGTVASNDLAYPDATRPSLDGYEAFVEIGGSIVPVEDTVGGVISL
ncbi:uncharacterized protein METZ01_LOCUS120278, partial [marine metagenome]